MPDWAAGLKKQCQRHLFLEAIRADRYLPDEGLKKASTRQDNTSCKDPASMLIRPCVACHLPVCT